MKRQVWFISVMVVLVAVLAGGLFYLRYCLLRSREATLKQDLVMMRMAIDNYALEKQHAPQSLQDLVREHYLKEIPRDPFTGKQDWVLGFEDITLNPHQADRGIDDVHAASGEVGRNGAAYNRW